METDKLIEEWKMYLRSIYRGMEYLENDNVRVLIVGVNKVLYKGLKREESIPEFWHGCMSAYYRAMDSKQKEDIDWY